MITTKNNLNPLPFYFSKDKQSRRSLQGLENFQLICGKSNLLPFQLQFPKTQDIELSEIYLCNCNDEIVQDFGDVLFNSGLKYYYDDNVDNYIIYNAEQLSEELQTGTYYIRFDFQDGRSLYSDLFTVVDNIIDFVCIEFWNLEDQVYNNGDSKIIYNNYKNRLYINAELMTPEYDFDFTSEQRDGYDYAEKLLSIKKHVLKFFAPEFLCDLSRVIWNSDYVYITKNAELFVAQNITSEINWIDEKKAQITLSFVSDTIVKSIGQGATAPLYPVLFFGQTLKDDGSYWPGLTISTDITTETIKSGRQGFFAKPFYITQSQYEDLGNSIDVSYSADGLFATQKISLPPYSDAIRYGINISPIHPLDNVIGKLVFEINITDNSSRFDLRFPLTTANVTFDWGDGTTTTYNSAPSNGYRTHTYPATGIYTVMVSVNDTSLFDGRFTFGSSSSPYQYVGTYLTHIIRWADWCDYSLAYCINLISIPDEPIPVNPEITRVVNDLFRQCESLENIPSDLFVNAVNQTSLNMCFQNCSSLKAIPNGLIKNMEYLTDVNSMFSGCSSLLHIPVETFRSNINIEAFNSTFSGCSLLERVELDTFRYNTKVTSFNSTFSNCTSLSYLTNIFRYNTLVTTFASTFSGCSSLGMYGEKNWSELFRYNTLVTNFSSTFRDAYIGFVLPVNLFRYNTLVTTFNSTFRGALSLSSAALNLLLYNTEVINTSYMFAETNITVSTMPYLNYCTKLTNSSYMYYKCSSINAISFNYIASNTELTNCEGMFRECGIIAVGNGFFDNNTKLTNVSHCFRSNNITTVPDNLLANCPNILNASGLLAYNPISSFPENMFVNQLVMTNAGESFAGTNITTVPENILSNNSAITTINNLFTDCLNFNSAPLNLLSNLSNCTAASQVFRNCTSLTSVPTGFFDGCAATLRIITGLFSYSGLTTAQNGLFRNLNSVINSESNDNGIFLNCKNLTTIGADLFVDFTSVTGFNWTFEGCTSLTSIPNNLFDSNKSVTSFFYTFRNCDGITSSSPTGTDNIPLYQRQGKPGYPSSISGTGCFQNCIRMADYSSVPSGWR